MENPRSCVLCYKILEDGETQCLDHMFIDMLNLLLINLHIENPSVQPVCDICIGKIQSAFSFKTTCIETMDCLLPYFDSDGKLTTDLKTIYLKEKDKDENIDEHAKICSLCMKIVDRGSGAKLMELLEELHFQQNFEKYVPEVVLQSIHNPVVCNNCLISIQQFSDLIFMTSCLHSTTTESSYAVNKNNLYLLMSHNFNNSPKVTSKNEVQTIESDSTNTEIVENANKEVVCNPEPAKLVDTEHSYAENNPKNSIKTEEEVLVIDESDNAETNELFDKYEESPSSLNTAVEDDSQMVSPENLHIETTLPDNTVDNTDEVMIVQSDDTENSTIVIDSDSDIEIMPKSNEVTLDVVNESMSDDSYTNPSFQVYECDYCLFEANSPVLFFGHLETHKTRAVCSICQIMTRGLLGLEAHMLAQHREVVAKQDMTCKHCGLTTEYNYYFFLHMKMHVDELNYSKCNFCSFRTKYQDVLTIHVNCKHHIRCNECNFTTFSNFLLFQHCRKNHSIAREARKTRNRTVNYKED